MVVWSVSAGNQEYECRTCYSCGTRVFDAAEGAMISSHGILLWYSRISSTRQHLLSRASPPEPRFLRSVVHTRSATIPGLVVSSLRRTYRPTTTTPAARDTPVGTRAPRRSNASSPCCRRRAPPGPSTIALRAATAADRASAWWPVATDRETARLHSGTETCTGEGVRLDQTMLLSSIT